MERGITAHFTALPPPYPCFEIIDVLFFLNAIIELLLKKTDSFSYSLYNR